MANYFYMRISTREKNKELAVKEREQTFDRQKGIFERAGYELTEENTFAERISGKTKNGEREQFAKMLDVLQPNDWVYFTEVSRFSRSYINGMEMIDILTIEKKVNVKFVSNCISLEQGEKMNPYTWYTVSQMLLADELQRKVISYNTINGLQAKKDQGVLLGHNSGLTQEERTKIKELASQGMKQKDIAEMFGATTSTVSRIINGKL